MKKLVIFLAFLALANAGVKDEVEKVLKANGVAAKVEKVSDFADGLKLITLKIGTANSLVVASPSGKVILGVSEVLSEDKKALATLSSAQYELNEKNAKNAESMLKEQFKKSQNFVFSFNAKRPTERVLYIVSDPVCPYCKEELERLGTRLESANVKMLVVGALGENAMKKAAYINANISKDTGKNLELLRRVYAQKDAPKVSEQAVEATRKLTREVMGSGIRGVPYLFE